MRELVETLGVTRQTIHRWVKDGKFPAPNHINRSTFWLRDDVEKWLAGLSQQQQEG